MFTINTADSLWVQVWCESCKAAGFSLMGPHESRPLSSYRGQSLLFCLVACRDSFFRFTAAFPPVPPPPPSLCQSTGMKDGRSSHWRLSVNRCTCQTGCRCFDIQGIFLFFFYSFLSESTADVVPPVSVFKLLFLTRGEKHLQIKYSQL